MISLQKLSINCENTTKNVLKFIQNQVHNSGFDGVVVNISGGIDSAVTLHLAVMALGPENVTAITIPERDVTPESDITDVILHCEQLNLTCNTVDITEILRVIRNIMPKYDVTDRITIGNIRSRLRMIIAYHHANTERRLVLGTSNKTELLTGFFTKHGDGGVDLMPLGDLWKYNIKELANYLEIPENIIKKPPSPGFYKGHTDEDELGMSYDNIDLILFGYNKGLTIAEIVEETGIPIDEVKRILRRVKANQHKRRLPLILRLS
jgi:NAD+ synthase